jgi:hypothetical protein
MDNVGNKAAKEEKGNLTTDQRTQHSEENPVTKVKLPEQREPEKTRDLDKQKKQQEDQGRGDKV